MDAYMKSGIEASARYPISTSDAVGSRSLTTPVSRNSTQFDTACSCEAVPVWAVGPGENKMINH